MSNSLFRAEGFEVCEIPVRVPTNELNGLVRQGCVMTFTQFLGVVTCRVEMNGQSHKPESWSTFLAKDYELSGNGGKFLGVLLDRPAGGGSEPRHVVPMHLDLDFGRPSQVLTIAAGGIGFLQPVEIAGASSRIEMLGHVDGYWHADPR